MKVVSYSFFRHQDSGYESPQAGEGRGRFFIGYMPVIVRAHHSVYPDWEMRIHHDDRVREYPYFKALERMDAEGLVKLVAMGEAPSLCGAMAWRLRPIWDEAVSHVICRDVDSLSTPREHKAVDRWVTGGKAIHALHDSPSHGSTLLMGGMVGFVTAKVRATMPRPPEQLPVHGDDQRWLNAAVAPLFPNEILSDDHKSIGPREEPRDALCQHIGGAFHAQPAIAYFDKYEPNERILRCER